MIPMPHSVISRAQQSTTRRRAVARMAGLVSALALTATLTALPASAAGPRTLASGLVTPLSVDAEGKAPIHLTQNFAGTVSAVDGRGRISTVRQVDPGAGESVHGVSITRDGVIYVVQDADGPNGRGPTSTVVRTTRSGTRTVSADLWSHETKRNPDGRQKYGLEGLGRSCTRQVQAFQDAHPDGPPLLPYRGIVESNAYQTSVDGNTVWVADAAANTVLAVDTRRGSIRTVAVLPPVRTRLDRTLFTAINESLGGGLPECIIGRTFRSEAVPTDVRPGPDGYLYVSTLGGGLGEVNPQSVVYRVNPRSGSTRPVATGLFGTTGLDVDRHGNIYVAELFGGKVSVIRRGSSRTRTVSTAVQPADVVVDGKRLLVTTDALGEGKLVSLPLGR